MFYVYEWYVVESGDIFYVGKGTKRRYKCRNRNKLFNEMLATHKCDVRIVAYFDNEKDAYEYEFDRIKELRSIGQCSCNISDGGTGGSPDVWSDEMRQMFSEHNVMKSEDQRERMRNKNPMQRSDQQERMSKYNPMKDRVIAEKTNGQKRRPLIINGRNFRSVYEAMEAYGVSRSAIMGWCQRGTTPDGSLCHMLDVDAGEVYTLKNTGQKRAITYRGKHYSSATELAKELGVAQTTVSRWCRDGFDTSGNQIRYDDDTREIVMPASTRRSTIVVNGKWYPTKSAAARSVGISTYLLTQYLEHKKHSDDLICEYGNQQPSRENSSQSIPEGSTTNG